MSIKEKIVTAAVFVSSVFGGNTVKAANAERSEAPSDANIETTFTPENNDDDKKTYTGWRLETTQTPIVCGDAKGVINSGRGNSTPTLHIGSSNKYKTTHNITTGSSNRGGTTHNMTTGSSTRSNDRRGVTHNITTGSGQGSNPIERRISNTKKAIKNVQQRHQREWERAGAKFIYKLDREYRRARAEALRDARQKQRSDKRFAEDFQQVVSNALIFKYQVDRRRGLNDYIPHNTRKNIQNIAIHHRNEVYKMLRRNTNEDIVMNYMGQALEGVGYTQKGHIYEYEGHTVSIRTNLMKKMGLKNKGYTIGGDNAFSYGAGTGGRNIYTGR